MTKGIFIIFLILALFSSCMIGEKSNKDKRKSSLALFALLPSTSQTSTGCGLDPWTSRSASEANAWYTVTYGNNTFVTVSSDGTNRVMTSPDGITWTSRSASENNDWVSVGYINKLFVATAKTGTNRIMTSVDGVTWKASLAAEQNNWRSVTYGNNTFVAVSADGTNRVMTTKCK